VKERAEEGLWSVSKKGAQVKSHFVAFIGENYGTDFKICSTQVKRNISDTYHATVVCNGYVVKNCK
jgi:hypothetical protein